MQTASCPVRHDFDPLSEQYLADPYAVAERMREESPIFYAARARHVGGHPHGRHRGGVHRPRVVLRPARAGPDLPAVPGGAATSSARASTRCR